MDFENNKHEIKSNVSFPSQFSSTEEKKSHDFGRQLAMAIESYWLYQSNGASCRFMTQRTDFELRRAYASGTYSMTQFYDQIGTNGDTSLLNLPKKPITIVPKLVDVMVNSISNRGYNIRATAVDQLSKDNRNNYRKRLEKERIGAPVIQKAKELGINIASFEPDQIPQTDAEMELHMQLEYKPSQELSVELGIESVFNENDFDETVKKRVIRDIVTCGKGVAKRTFSPTRGVVLEYVDCANKIESYTPDPYYNDCSYHGEIKQKLISDVRMEFPWINDDQEILNALQSSGLFWYNYFGNPYNRQMEGTTHLMYFTYKTTIERAKKIKEKGTGEKVVSKASDYFDESKKNKNDKYKRVTTAEEVIFEGVYIVGTGKLIKWEIAKNMSRPKSNNKKVCSPYVTIAPKKDKWIIGSAVNEMIGLDNLIQVCELKAIQIIQKILPDGYQIDISALAELDLADGKVYSPIDHLNMMLQTGSIFVQSYGSGGEYNYAKTPISELKTGDSLGKLQALRNERDQLRNSQLEVIGYNKATDGSTPDKDSLVGVQKLAALNTNIATRHILDAASYVTKKIAELTVYDLQNITKYFPNLKEDLVRKIGATAVQDLEYSSDLHLFDYAIFLDLHLDDEERAKLEQDINLEIEKGTLSTADKYRILNIKNFKQAVGAMAIIIDKNKKLIEKQKIDAINAQAEANSRSTQAAEQARMQTEMSIIQGKIQLQQITNEGLRQKEIEKGNQERLTLQLKLKSDENIAHITSNASIQKQAEMEDRKDQRAAKEATMQGQLSNVKENNAAPIDFEQQEQDKQMFQVDSNYE